MFPGCTSAYWEPKQIREGLAGGHEDVMDVYFSAVTSFIDDRPKEGLSFVPVDDGSEGAEIGRERKVADVQETVLEALIFKCPNM